MRFRNILLTTALIAFSGVAFAQGWHGEHHADMLFRTANLTDAQKAQMKTIEEAGWTQAKPMLEQIRALHQQVESQLLSPGAVSAADLAPLVSQEETLRNQIDQIRVNAGLQMRSVLTPAQLADAAAKHAQLASLHQQEKAVEEAR